MLALGRPRPGLRVGRRGLGPAIALSPSDELSRLSACLTGFAGTDALNGMMWRWLCWAKATIRAVSLGQSIGLAT